jgi:hypothetical protein
MDTKTRCITMVENETKGKWAVEAHEFLKLFTRYAQTPAGLLLAIIGWTLLLVLVARLSKVGETPMLTIPFPSFSGVTYDVRLPLTSVFSLGSLIMFAFWSITSRTFFYAYCPLSRLLRNIRLLTLHIAFVLIMALHAPIYYALLKPLERRKTAKWRASKDPTWIAAIIQEHGQDGTKALDDKAREETGFKAEWLTDVAGDLWVNQMIALASANRVALAPFKTYSLAESQKAIKTPNQMFATAISWLRSELGTLHMTRYSQFLTLPEYPPIGTESQAKWTRRLLFCDALTWGSFISVQPAKVWLNIETRRHAGKDTSSHLEADPFMPIQPRTSAMIIDPDDPVDLYVALLCILREAVEARRIPQFRLYPRAADRFALSRTELNALVVSLLKNVLFDLQQVTPSNVHMVLSAKTVLVRIASDWAIYSLDKDAAYRRPQRWQEIRATLRKCVQLDPACPEHYYRLGAACLLLDQESAAVSAFSKAQSMERHSLWRDPILVQSTCSTYLRLLRYETSDFREIAHATTCVARCLALVGEIAIPDLRAEFEKSEFWKLCSLLRKQEALDAPVPLKVLLKLLNPSHEVDGRPKMKAKASVRREVAGSAQPDGDKPEAPPDT